MDTLQFLQSVLDRAVGPGATPGKIQRVQLWDLYSILPLFNDSDLAGKTFELFTFKPGDLVSGPGFVPGTSPQYKVTKADTNIDAPGTIPFDMFIHGLSLDFINRQLVSGAPNTANDMTQWARAKDAFLTDTYAAFNINDTDVDRLTFVEAPAGAGLAVTAAAMGTTAVLATSASVSQADNGLPISGNYRNYANEGPFFCPINTTIKINCTFGNSLLAAAQIYKPANTGTPTIFAKAVLRGFRIWWAI